MQSTSSLWSEKYFPQLAEEFIGNSELVDNALKWASNWNSKIKGKSLLFYGMTGAGKTCLAFLLAKLNDWELFELNASSLRDKESIERLAGNAALNSSFSGKLRLILIDEVDCLQSVDRGGYAAIANICKQSQNPVILTANDLYANQNLAQFRSLCTLFEFKKINYLSIAKRLREILEIEKISFDPEAIKLLAKNSAGDFRSALLDIQALSFSGNISLNDVASMSAREREENIFNVLKALFKAKTFSDARSSISNAAVDPNLVERWIEENIPREFKPNEIPSAMNIFSRADIFNGRILKRQHWGFKKYSNDLMTAGLVFSISKPNYDFVMYQFPGLLSKLKKASSTRVLKNEVASKIGSKTHCSKKQVLSQELPFLSVLFEKKENLPFLTYYFGFNENELAFLTEKKSDSKLIQNAIEQANLIKQEKLIEKQRQNFSFISNELSDKEKKLIAASDKNQKKLFG